MSGRRRMAGAFMRNPTACLGAVVVLLVVAYCVLVPALSPYDPDKADFTSGRQAPSAEHWLGTDQYGRDILTRLAAGRGTTLLIAGAALAVILVLGVGYGATSGLLGGRVDAAMMRILDGLLAIPRLPVSIVILVFVGLQAQNVQTVVLALAIVNWMIMARLVRGEVVFLKQQDYVRAARALGGERRRCSPPRHVVPERNSGSCFVALFLELPAVILGEAFLAVLGLGPAAPTATWGNDRSRRHYLRTAVARLPPESRNRDSRGRGEHARRRHWGHAGSAPMAEREDAPPLSGLSPAAGARGRVGQRGRGSDGLVLFLRPLPESLVERAPVHAGLLRQAPTRRDVGLPEREAVRGGRATPRACRARVSRIG